MRPPAPPAHRVRVTRRQLRAARRRARPERRPLPPWTVAAAAIGLAWLARCAAAV